VVVAVAVVAVVVVTVAVVGRTFSMFDVGRRIRDIRFGALFIRLSVSGLTDFRPKSRLLGLRRLIRTPFELTTQFSGRKMKHDCNYFEPFFIKVKIAFLIRRLFFNSLIKRRKKYIKIQYPRPRYSIN
jgi:hypothetical protein